MNLSAEKTHPGAETRISFGKPEHAAAGDLLLGYAFAAQVVVHGVAAAEPAIDEVDGRLSLEHVVAVVVVAVDDGLHVSSFQEQAEETAVHAGRAGIFEVVAHQIAVGSLPESPFNFPQRDMEESQGRHGLASVGFLQPQAVILVPVQLTGADVVVAVGFLQALENYGIHRVEEVEYAVCTTVSLQGYHIIGTAVNAVFSGSIYAAGETPDQGEHLLPRGAELGIMVPQGHSPGNAALGQGSKDFPGALQVRLAENDVSRVDDKVWLDAFDGIFHALQGPLRTGVSGDVMCVCKLQHGEGAVFPVGKRCGYAAGLFIGLFHL